MPTKIKVKKNKIVIKNKNHINIKIDNSKKTNKKTRTRPKYAPAPQPQHSVFHVNLSNPLLPNYAPLPYYNAPSPPAPAPVKESVIVPEHQPVFIGPLENQESSDSGGFFIPTPERKGSVYDSHASAVSSDSYASPISTPTPPIRTRLPTYNRIYNPHTDRYVEDNATNRRSIKRQDEKALLKKI
jgi:hypothetical protein